MARFTITRRVALSAAACAVVAGAGLLGSTAAWAQAYPRSLSDLSPSEPTKSVWRVF